MKTAREEAVQAISDSGHHKRHQRPNKSLIKKQRDKDWNQRHPEDGQHVWQGDNPRGHETISDFDLRLLIGPNARPRALTRLRNNQAGVGEISDNRWMSHAHAMPGSAAQARTLPVDSHSELAGPRFPVRA